MPAHPPPWCVHHSQGSHLNVHDLSLLCRVALAPDGARNDVSKPRHVKAQHDDQEGHGVLCIESNAGGRRGRDQSRGDASKAKDLIVAGLGTAVMLLAPHFVMSSND